MTTVSVKNTQYVVIYFVCLYSQASNVHDTSMKPGKQLYGSVQIFITVIVGYRVQATLRSKCDPRTKATVNIMSPLLIWTFDDKTLG